MTSWVGSWRAIAIAAAVFLASGSGSAAELDVLKGQSIRAIIGGNAGGGTDVLGRIFLASLGRALRDTTINVQTIGAGAGAGAVKELFEARGRVITVSIFSTTPIYAQLMGTANVPFDVSKLRWLGSLADGRRVLAVRKGLNAPNLEALRGLSRQPIAATSDALASSTIDTLLLNAILGLRIKVVPGFGDAQVDTMLLAGDADVRLSGTIALGPLFASGDMVPIMRIGDGAYPDSMKSLPKLADLARPSAPNDLVFLLETLNQLGRPYAAAPDTAPEVVDALRAAFEIAIADPQYLAAMEQREAVGKSTSGAELTAAIERLFNPSAEIGPLVRKYRDCGARVSDNLPGNCD
jgi:tripartite-type tricarboxylate transporter receptor subunit TctC